MKTIKHEGRTLVPMGTVWDQNARSLKVEFRVAGAILSERVPISQWNQWERANEPEEAVDLEDDAMPHRPGAGGAD